MDVSKEGVLQKWTNYIYGWKKRYFVLHDGLLEYCKNRGDELKGKISVFTLALKKHPKKDTELILNTGVTNLHLRAANPKEAQEWFVALKRASSLNPSQACNRTYSKRDSVEESAPKTLSLKVGEMWSVYAIIGESIDSIPPAIRSKCPQLEKTMSLFNTFKLLASETLSFLESEDTRSVASKYMNERHSVDSLDFSSMMNGKGVNHNINQSVIEEAKDEDSVYFEDAQSHVSEEKEEYLVPHRKSLPFLRDPKKKYNIWKVVKDSIGKDLSKMAVPVYFNEPISFLQRYTEDLAYHEILLNACEIEDSLLRIAYIACFAVTSYVPTLERYMKPFNPLLGETFELVRDGYRVVCEQVSHHPPISAMLCEHRDFSFSGSVNIKTSFKGTHLCVTPVGTYQVRLNQFEDVFEWSKPQTNVHNIIFGKMYVDHFGKVEIENRRTGEKASLNFHKKGWFDRISHEVNGAVNDHNGNPRYRIFGQWHKQMCVEDLRTNKTIVVWEKFPNVEGYDYNYFFSDFSIQLNLPPEHFPGLPRTDSRYRPDQRALENGDLKLAVSEKHRLEEKQRAARAVLESQGKSYKAMWFREEKHGWVYNGGYWESREIGNFENIPEIF